MTSKRNRADTQSDRILRCEICWCPKTPGDEITIFFHVGGQLIRWTIIRTHLCLPGEDNDITTFPIPIKIECDPGVLLQMCVAFGICQTINEESGGGFIPLKPDRRRLWRAF